ncbi:MAG TPA: DNA repair protein RadC [Alphaproteobacteria bacterium]|jgi:DNA repair protein RadC|nr:DNA repair protein RadC [Alphaproteobacteria bacterium]
MASSSKLTSLPLSLRPREKLLKSGSEILTLEELIAVILVTGTKKEGVFKLAKKIAKLLPTGKEKLLNLGLGKSKTSQILACVELGKRLLEQNKTVTITSGEQVFALSYDIVNQEKESLICFYLNARNELLKKEIMAVGSLNKVNLLPREIFSQIKELPVASIILAHNHPSGSLDASKEDIIFTERVKQAGEILGVKLLDHLIVTSSGWSKIGIRIKS